MSKNRADNVTPFPETPLTILGRDVENITAAEMDRFIKFMRERVKAERMRELGEGKENGNANKQKL